MLNVRIWEVFMNTVLEGDPYRFEALELLIQVVNAFAESFGEEDTQIERVGSDPDKFIIQVKSTKEGVFQGKLYDAEILLQQTIQAYRDRVPAWQAQRGMNPKLTTGSSVTLAKT
jgi:hypothetical protein